jgi:hypothetical protein
MQAMPTMQKLDIAALERAHRRDCRATILTSC